MGITTFVTPVRPAQSIGSVKLRNARHGQPENALYLEEVAFTVYYPTEKPTNLQQGVDWFIRPIKESLNGFASFLGISTWLLWPVVYLFGSLIKIPAYPNAPLLNPMESTTESEKPSSSSQWPLIIFSHGLGGSRTAYSQLCCHLAASGRVVLAVEHRDGTGTACIPQSWKVDGKRTSRTLLYLRENDIRWEDDDTVQQKPFALRVEQLAFRHQELYIAYSTFRHFVQNDPVEIDTIDGPPISIEGWTNVNSEGRPSINCDEDVILAGHSFGGCTMLSILSTPPAQGFGSIPVSKVVILDPWLEPLPSPGPTPFVRPEGPGMPPISTDVDYIQESLKSSLTDKLDSPHPRMLVINSETFTLWKDHFARLQEVVSGWEPHGGRILTLVGSVHTSFSDFPVMPIIRKKSARPLLETISTLSLAFLDDRLEETLVSEVSTTNMEIEVIGLKKDGKPKRKLIGNVGDVIVL